MLRRDASGSLGVRLLGHVSDKTTRGHGVFISRVVPESPAAKVVVVGDRIIGQDGHDVSAAAWTQGKLMDRLTGLSGSIRLSVIYQPGGLQSHRLTVLEKRRASLRAKQAQTAAAAAEDEDE